MMKGALNVKTETDALFHSAAERGCHEAGRSCCAVGGLSRRPPQAALLSLTALPGVDSNMPHPQAERKIMFTWQRLAML